MAISVKVRVSHLVVYRDKPTPVSLIVRLVPESYQTVKGMMYVFVLDNSPSMKDEGKLGIAISALHKMVNEIPPGNLVEVYYFSNDLEKVYEGISGRLNDFSVPFKYGATTNLYKALSKVLNRLAQEKKPTKLVVLSDGKPTDKRNPKDYESLKVPDYVQVVAIGIGKDYNEVIMKKLSDIGNGTYYHITDVNELPKVFEEQKVTDAAGYNVSVEFPNGVELVNYEKNPVVLPVLSSAVSIYAQYVVPPGDSDFPLNVSVSYVDPATNARATVNVPLTLRRGTEDEVRGNYDVTIEDEVKYFTLLRAYAQAIEKGSKEVTKIYADLSALAAKTRREDLLAITRKLGAGGTDSKDLLSATTRVLRKS